MLLQERHAVKEAVFKADTYVTPPGKESLTHKLLFRCRIYYIMRFIGVVLRYWDIARKGLDHETWSQAAYDIFKIVEDCGGRFHLAGLDNLRKVDGPVVFIGNHMSALETLVPMAFIVPYKRPVFVIKEQLLTVPFFGAYVRECIGVTRRSPAEDLKQVLTRGTDKIAQDRSIMIFPQATRSVEFIREKFNTLGVKLAKRAGVPVIPMAVKTDFWGNGKIIKDFGPLHLEKMIHFEFGEPMTIAGHGKEEHERIMEFIQARLARWRAEDAQAQEVST
jgi:1-acyl-sn-glycerol-3-phosphate acyltransferase